MEYIKSEYIRVRGLLEPYAGLFLAAFVVLVYIIVFTYGLWFYSDSKASSELQKNAKHSEYMMQLNGQFGDFFGSANALFSMFAFLGVLAALKKNREAIALQQKAVELQQAENNRQSFDAMFFHLLTFHSGIVKNIDPSITAIAKDAWSAMYGNISIVDYEVFYETQANPQLGHYFLNLYQLISFVDACAPSPEHRKRCINIVRAQLSSDELGLLAVNAASSFGAQQFKPLIEKYALLKHLPKEERYSLLAEHFDKSAFGDGPIRGFLFPPETTNAVPSSESA